MSVEPTEPTISNPNAAIADRVRIKLEREDAGPSERKPIIAIRKLRWKDPDAEFDKLVSVVRTKFTEVNATLMERRGRGLVAVNYPNIRSLMEAKHVRRRVLDQLSASNLRELGDRLRSYVNSDKELREARTKGRARVEELVKRGTLPANVRESDFYLGLYSDEVTAAGGRSVFPIQDTILPTLNSPQSKQQLFMDYLDMHRKSWEAATRNPIGKRICVAGDTHVSLLNGTEIPIETMAARGGAFWVYACKEGRVYPAEAYASFTGVRQVFAVTLDNGAVVKATADHPFMLRDGSYREVRDLRPGDSLMPLYRKILSYGKNPYEQVYHPDLGLWEHTHRMVARNTQRDLFLLRPMGKAGWHTHLHHEDHDSRNNEPANLRYLSQLEHVTLTSRREQNKAIKRALPQSVNFGSTIKKLWADPAWREQQRAKFRAAANPARRQRLSDRAKESWQDPTKRARYEKGMATREPIAIDPATGRFVKKAANNHKVISVVPVGETAVFDLHVPGFSNFAVSAGVFVHNCDIIPQFVLGRGMTADIESPQHQDAWDQFFVLNRMRGRYRLLLKELLIYGENFLRYFKTKKGLEVRMLDPSTIWDIVTNPLDNEDVYYYHQQYSVMNVSPVPFYSAVYPAQLVIRQIPASEIDHYKINHVSSEKRGRSQLYSILGWLLRFKEFANDRVLLNKMRSMFALDVSVEGSAEDVASAEAQFAVPPGPGAVLVHNKAVEIDFKNANNNANEAKTDAEMILKIIAIGAGVSEQFLGVSGAATRAGALIQTEPDVKNFETYQEILEDICEDQWARVQVSARLPAIDKRMEFNFAGLAAEDRSTKLKDIAFAESMDYFSKERAATMAAREFGVSNYDYDHEIVTIRQERENDPVISATLQQTPKIAPDPLAAAEEPGLGADHAPGAEEPAAPTPEGFSTTDPKVAHTSGQMGFSAKRLSGRNPANTKATLDRGSFNRGNERTKIKNNRSEGTPLQASGYPRPRHVWNDEARAKALQTRRANQQRRAETLGTFHETQRPAPDPEVIVVTEPEIVETRTTPPRKSK